MGATELTVVNIEIGEQRETVKGKYHYPTGDDGQVSVEIVREFAEALVDEGEEV